MTRLILMNDIENDEGKSVSLEDLNDASYNVRFKSYERMHYSLGVSKKDLPLFFGEHGSKVYIQPIKNGAKK
ncbi:hypothetical protein COU57_00760 [Candidatus Pacearchaeota archaeon CG10_big_fil_rev_8_21_14_0_10_32_14]|nr:MAG: hypothetical protein COU57_00760 [Candidatus Pacearchaeota archaeon CG10_big_fil_rev_8_21_14_0_10_32_14]